MFHKDLAESDIHTLVAATYADMAARDADTDFCTSAANLHKMVCVESPAGFYLLLSVSPAWFAIDDAGDETFIAHPDTPASYSGQGGLAVQVNAGGTGLEFGQDLTPDGSPAFGGLAVSAAADVAVTLEATTADQATLNLKSDGIQKAILGYDEGAGRFVISHLEAGTSKNDLGLTIKENAVGIGTNDPLESLHVAGAIRTNSAFKHGTVVVVDYFGNGNYAYGDGFGNITTAQYNLAVGDSSLVDLTEGSYNVAIGRSTLRMLTTGSNNLAVGSRALFECTTGANNVSFGRQSLELQTSGNNNLAVGYQALQGVAAYVVTGNVAMGYRAGWKIATGADGNVLLGFGAGDNLTTGARNILLGYNLDAYSETDSERLNVGNLLFGTGLDGTNGTISSGNIGIGLKDPGYKLEVAGEIRSSEKISVESTGPLLGLRNSRTIMGLGYAVGEIAFQAGELEIQDVALIRVTATENWTDTTSPTKMTFYTTAPDSATRSLRMTLDELGQLGIGEAEPAYPLDIVGGTNLIPMRLSDGSGDLVAKAGGFCVRHYTNAEEDVLAIALDNSLTANTLSYGGGSNDFNAATKHSFFTAADTATTRGTEQVIINDIGLEVAGRVGVGISPSYDLHIQKDVAGAVYGRIYNDDSIDGVARLLVGASGGGHVSLVANSSLAEYVGIPPNVCGISVDWGGVLAFAVGNSGTATEKMRLTEDGSLGLGVDPERMFHLQGTNAVMRIDRDRNSPGILIHRYPTGDFTTPWKGFLLGVDGHGADDGDFFINDTHEVTSGGGDQRFRIDSVGDVHIGSGLPTAKLDVEGDLAIRSAIRFEDGSTQISAIPPAGAWHLTTAVHKQTRSITVWDTSPRAMCFKPDGRSLYFTGVEGTGNIYELDLQAGAWDVSGAIYSHQESIESHESNPMGLCISPDGARLYVCGSGSDAANQFRMTTPWDLTSLDWVAVFDLSAKETQPAGIQFRPDGRKMYIIGTSSDAVNEYDLTIAWDVTSAVWLQAFGTDIDAPTDLHFRPDGAKMYVMDGSAEDDIHEYDLFSPWDVSTAVLHELFDVSAQNATPQGIAFSPDGSKMFMIGSGSPASLFGYEMGLMVPGGPLGLSSLTTTERNALVAIDGMMIYNTTTNAFNFRESGSWVTK